MSYRCLVCHYSAPKGQPMIKRIIYRKDGTIHREIPVCAGCDNAYDKSKPVPVQPVFAVVPKILTDKPKSKPVIAGKSLDLKSKPLIARPVCEVCASESNVIVNDKSYCTNHVPKPKRSRK